MIVRNGKVLRNIQEQVQKNKEDIAGTGKVLEWGNIEGSIADQTDLQTALNNKASTSTTTNLQNQINNKANQSDLTAEITNRGTAVSNEATARANADANLQNQINNKQNVLISGTNVKTIKGESIVGGGNIDLGNDVRAWVLKSTFTYQSNTGGVFNFGDATGTLDDGMYYAEIIPDESGIPNGNLLSTIFYIKNNRFSIVIGDDDGGNVGGFSFGSGYYNGSQSLTIYFDNYSPFSIADEELIRFYKYE